jgi:hypothetical protein
VIISIFRDAAKAHADPRHLASIKQRPESGAPNKPKTGSFVNFAGRDRTNPQDATGRTMLILYMKEGDLMKREHPYRLVCRVTDLNHMDYDVVKALLDQNGVDYDCIFIETKRGVAYVYQYRHPYRVFYEA